jgi:hypothetical protein
MGSYLSLTHIITRCDSKDHQPLLALEAFCLFYGSKSSRLIFRDLNSVGIATTTMNVTLLYDNVAN